MGSMHVQYSPLCDHNEKLYLRYLEACEHAAQVVGTRGWSPAKTGRRRHVRERSSVASGPELAKAARASICGWLGLESRGRDEVSGVGVHGDVSPGSRLGIGDTVVDGGSGSLHDDRESVVEDGGHDSTVGRHVMRHDKCGARGDSEQRRSARNCETVDARVSIAEVEYSAGDKGGVGRREGSGRGRSSGEGNAEGVSVDRAVALCDAGSFDGYDVIDAVSGAVAGCVELSKEGESRGAAARRRQRTRATVAVGAKCVKAMSQVTGVFGDLGDAGCSVAADEAFFEPQESFDAGRTYCVYENGKKIYPYLGDDPEYTHALMTADFW